MTVYLAGPMRGYPEFNFPAFKLAAKWLRARGYDVISPAEMDEQEMFNPKTSEGLRETDWYIKRDLLTILALSEDGGIVMLPGWQSSVGARAEEAVARWRGLRVLDYQALRMESVASDLIRGWEL